MSMDTPDNYYAILGVPIDADSDTLKQAYRQLARRYHPDLAGPDGAVQMKRINRAYDVLSDPQKRLNYDTIIGGVIDLRQGGLTRARPKPGKFNRADDVEFAGLSIFSTRGPLQTGPKLRTALGVISTLGSVRAPTGLLIAAGSLDGKGLLWQVNGQQTPTSFATDSTLPTESLRELRFSPNGRFLAGWGRLGLHTWDAYAGTLLWSLPLGQRAVSAHYSLDLVIQETRDGQGEIIMALPLLTDDNSPRSRGVRGTDIIRHPLNTPTAAFSSPLVCAEDEVEKRQFWAIRLRTLAQNAQTLLTLSCAHVPGETDEIVVIRRWDLTARTRFSGKSRPQIHSSILAGQCASCAPPYAVTPDASYLAYVSTDSTRVAARTVPTTIRLYHTGNGTYSELPSGAMGGSSRLAISPDARWLAVAREDSEINEGVIDLYSVSDGQVIQKLYHPWQISATHFMEQQLVVALTDGTIQVWR
jgi:hypothetical protein